MVSAHTRYHWHGDRWVVSVGRGLFSLDHKQLLLCASDRRVKPRTGSWRRTQAPRAPWPMFSEFLVNPQLPMVLLEPCALLHLLVWPLLWLAQSHFLSIWCNENWWKYKTPLKIRKWKPLVHTICRLRTLVDFRNVGFRLCSERMVIGFIVGLFLIGVKNTPCENPLLFTTITV